MTIKKRIENKKLRYDINREAEKTSALSPSKIDKYEYLTGEETLRSYQSKVIVLAKFTYFLANICWSPRRLEARLQHKNFWSCECFFRTSSKTSWRRLEDVFQKSWRPTKCLLGRNLYLFLRDLNLYLTNLYQTNLYLKSLRRIQDKSKMN